jgi:dolichyl-phosphate beta-glucosyltransferase
MEAWLGYTAYSLFLLFLQLGILASTSLFVFLYVYLKFTTTREPDLSRADSEKSFTDPSSNSTKPFPSIGDAPSLYLSLVIPAYKEEKRLPKMMDETIAYLEDRKVCYMCCTYPIMS